MTSRQPTSWDQYERGVSPGGNDSLASTPQGSVQFDEQQGILGEREDRGSGSQDWTSRLRRRYAASRPVLSASAVAD